MEWKKVLDTFYQVPSNKVTKEKFPSLVAQLWGKLKGECVVAGFRKTGLHPFNHAALDDKVMQDPLDLSNPSCGKGYVMAKSEAERKL